jgi:uncharacterized membrane protein
MHGVTYIIIIFLQAQQMDQIRKEEENILKEYEAAMKQKAEQEKRMHEAMHTEIQEKRLKGQLLWNSFRS